MPNHTAAIVLACTIAPSVLAQGDVTGNVPLSGEAPRASGYADELVTDGLERPWAFAWLPDDGIWGDNAVLVTERAGRLRLIRDSELVRAPLLDNIPNLFAQGQGGLMDVALHPDFDTNRTIYLTYSEGTRESNRTVLARATLTENAVENFEVLFRVNIDKPGRQHFGSRILWLPDNTMLLAIGDGGNPPVRYQGEFIRNLAQDPRTHIGKVLHLTENGEPAGGADLEGTPEVYSLGHRNIQGMAYDPDTRTVWASEHGARGGDELNIILPGANYGWPLATYSREYYGPRISDATTGPDFTDPTIVWTPSKAPSGLTFYTGDLFPEWKGDLFSGALVARHIRRIDLEGTEVRAEETIPTEGRVRDVRTGLDGAIYYVTDEQNGELRRLVPEL